jgi:pimeloyl-ACP methyl ester carboxylesterase
VFKTIAKVFAALVLLLLAIVAVLIALSWAPGVPVESLKARWAPEPSRFLDIEGMQVHYRDEGPRDAPTIVLLHGTSASLHTWEGWVAGLKQDYRVVSLDLPAFGLTGPFPTADYSIANYSRFLAEVLNRLEVPTASFAGNSFGGQLAWQFTVDHPERVERLILVDAAGYPRQSTSVPVGFKIAGMPLLRPLMANVLPRSLIESSVRSVYGDPSIVDEALIDRYYDLALREGNRKALRERFQQSLVGVEPERIASIEKPTLIIWGGRDGLIAPSNAERFHADIKGSRLVMFDELGHVPQEEAPAETLAVVREFLAKP